MVRCNVYMYIWYPVTEMSIQLVDYWDTDIQPQPENFTSPPTCSSFQHCLPRFQLLLSRPFFLFLKFIFVFLNHSHCPGHFLITPLDFSSKTIPVNAWVLGLLWVQRGLSCIRNDCILCGCGWFFCGSPADMEDEEYLLIYYGKSHTE